MTKIKNYAAALSVLLVVSLSLGYLWMENRRLEKMAQALQRPVSAARDAEGTSPEPLNVQHLTPEDKAAKPQETPPQDAGAQQDQALTGLLSPDIMVKMAADAARQESVRTVNRLNLRLKLTGEQKSKLTAFLDEDQRASLKLLEKAAADGLLDRMMKDPVNISAADQALVEEMQMVAQKPEAMDVFLDSILTPDQLAEYSKSKEEQRVSRAEDTAQASVSYFGQQFDLTPLQKDQLFDAVSRREMARSAPGAGAVSGEETGDSDEAILQSVLTPEQFDVWQQSRQPREDAAQKAAR